MLFWQSWQRARCRPPHHRTRTTQQRPLPPRRPWPGVTGHAATGPTLGQPQQDRPWPGGRLATWSKAMGACQQSGMDPILALGSSRLRCSDASRLPPPNLRQLETAWTGCRPGPGWPSGQALWCPWPGQGLARWRSALVFMVRSQTGHLAKPFSFHGQGQDWPGGRALWYSWPGPGWSGGDALWCPWPGPGWPSGHDRRCVSWSCIDVL